MRRGLRRAAPLLLVAGALLLVAVLVWPTQHLVSRTDGGTERLVDIWFGGRVRGVSDAISANGDGSPGLVALVVVAIALLLLASVAWLSSTGRGAPDRRAGRAALLAAAAAALGAAVTSVMAVVLARDGSASFGWASTREFGQLDFERTPIAFLVPAAAALAALAVVAMLVVLVRRRPQG